jgi:hypothetical protein
MCSLGNFLMFSPSYFFSPIEMTVFVCVPSVSFDSFFVFF